MIKRVYGVLLGFILILVGASFVSAGLNVSFGANSDSGIVYRNSIFLNVSSQGDTNISTFVNFNNSLIGWWRMDDLTASGGIADYFGINNMTLTGSPVQSDGGKFGKAMNFSGATGSYFSSSGTFHILGTKTVSVWANPKCMAGAFQMPVASGANYYLALYDVCVGNYFYVSDTNSSGSQRANSFSGIVIPNEWHMYTVVWNVSGVNVNKTIYVDGVVRGSLSSTQGYGTPDSTIYIGSLGANYPMNGSVDDVMLFNRSLEAAEVAALYANTSSKSLVVNFTGLNYGNYTFQAYSQDLNGVVNSSSGSVEYKDSSIFLSMIYPTSNMIVSRGFFNVSVNVTCLGQDCGDINVSLDPLEGTSYPYQSLFSGFTLGPAITSVRGYEFNISTVKYAGSLCFYGVGNSTVNLYNSSLSIIGTKAIIGGATANWTCADLPKPIQLLPGTYYVARVVLSPSAYYTKTLSGLPRTSNGVTITRGCTKTGAVYSAPLSCTTLSVFGLADVGLTNSISSKYGLVNTTFGATPFYTNATSNPLTITLNSNQSQVVTFWVNATGNDSFSEFFIYANKTSNMVTSNISTYWNVTIDLTGPLTTNVSYSPNMSNDIDSGTNLTFLVRVIDSNVTVSSAILQYYNGTGWKNSTMFLVGGDSYQANITTEPSELNYTFNIWSNDTFGNVNISANFTFSSYWDCTWNVSLAGLTGAAAMGSFEDKVIGNITIMNTGDIQYWNNNCTVSFDADNYAGFSGTYWSSLNWPSSKTGLRFSPLSPIVLGALENRTVNISASFPGVENPLEENPIITIFSNISDSVTNSNNRTVLVSMIVAEPGPYLKQNILSSSETIYLTNQTLNLSAYLQNLGGDGTENNSAYNVSYNWTLPSNLALNASSGVLFFDNISNNSFVYNNLSLELNETTLPSLTQGVYRIYLYSNGRNRTGDLIIHAGNITRLSNSINLTLLCYTQNDGICVASCGYTADPDCSAPAQKTSGSGSGGGGGGDGGTRENSDALFELLRGKAQQFVLPITNKLSMAKTDIEISVMGPNAEYIKLLTTSIARLEPNSTQDVIVEITAPAYFSKGEYVLYFTIQGKVEGGSAFYERKKVTLFIVEVSRTAADQALASSIKMVGEMNRSGMRTDKVSKLLSEMNAFYVDYNFEGVQKNFEALSKIYKAAFDARNLLNELNEGIRESERNGVEVIETKKILYVGENAYNRGDYVLAVERLNEAKLSYALETKGEFSIYHTIKNNPVQSVGILVSALIVGLGSTTLIRFRLLKRKLKMLEDEEKLLLELMKVVQREAFEKNSMSMEEYQQAMGQYENKLSQTIEEKITVEAKLLYMFKAKGRKSRYGDERKRLMELIGDLQDRYMNKGTIETRIYGNMLKSYTARLSEIDETLAFLEAKKAIKAGGFIGKK